VVQEPVTTSVGWSVLHLFCRVTPGSDGSAVVKAVTQTVDADHQVVTFAVLGHKADVGFMALGPDAWRLRRLQTLLQGAGLDIVDSYVSMTEVSEYAQDMPDDMKTPRLYPRLPPEGKPAICFYPMSKRREQVGNWFALPFDRRKELMYEHGASGRKFRGRVLQVVTGSTGVDDFEWGVTLFGQHLDDLKEVVYTMRFDEASAVYGEFGRFVTGMVADPVTVVEQVGLSLA
jgi:chlorite dismutase